MEQELALNRGLTSTLCGNFLKRKIAFLDTAHSTRYEHLWGSYWPPYVGMSAIFCGGRGDCEGREKVRSEGRRNRNWSWSVDAVSFERQFSKKLWSELSRSAL